MTSLESGTVWPAASGSPLGQSLISLGHITSDTLADALKKQADLPGVRIGKILIDIGVSEEIVTEALAKQAGFNWMKLSDKIIPTDLAHKVPPEYARKHKLVPIEERDDAILVAVCDPGDMSYIQMVGRIFNKPVTPIMVSDSDLEIALDRAYGRKTELRAIIGGGTSGKRSDHTGTLNQQDDDDPLQEAAAVRVLDQLLSRAARDGASDIHIEPFERQLSVRLRIDGVLHEVGVERVSMRALAARCKILANLDTAEMRRPQDGRFRAEPEGRKIDIRISTVPTAFGEKIVMRMLDRTRALLDLSSLGMEGVKLTNFQEAIRKPHGLILVTGPTGSGKTTTLYAALSERNNRGLNIMTIEDPVEYDIPGVNQIQVHNKIDVTFANGLRHVLRQDPDIILVGEIRDKETAEVAIQSAMTGHLVLSTLHTNDAIGAIARLLDMGIEPFLVADSVITVLAQRLVRKLCQSCRKSSTVTINEARDFVIEPGATIYRANGCARCLGTGYRGRIGLYEHFTISRDVATMIRIGTHSDRILLAARQEGHAVLREDGIAKALAGVTTLDEVERVA